MQTGNSTAGAAGSTVNDADRPRLAAHARLAYDPVRRRHVLLAPETVSILNQTGAAILGLCDGQRTVAGIAAELRTRYNQVPAQEVRLFLSRLTARQYIQVSHE